jgi:hypothetical protein
VDGAIFNCLKLWDSTRSAKFMSCSVFCFTNILLLQILKIPINTQIHKSEENVFFYCRTWSFWNIYFRLTQTLNECLWFCLLVLFVHVLMIILLPSLAFKNDLMDFSHLRTATSDVKSLSLCLSNLQSTSTLVTSTILVNSVKISVSVCWYIQ